MTIAKEIWPEVSSDIQTLAHKMFIIPKDVRTNPAPNLSYPASKFACKIRSSWQTALDDKGRQVMKSKGSLLIMYCLLFLDAALNVYQRQ